MVVQIKLGIGRSESPLTFAHLTKMVLSVARSDLSTELGDAPMAPYCSEFTLKKPSIQS